MVEVGSLQGKGERSCGGVCRAGEWREFRSRGSIKNLRMHHTQSQACIVGQQTKWHFLVALFSF